MARLKADELRQVDTPELQRRLAVLSEERFRLKFRRATETIDNPVRLRTLRRDIARLRTVLRERRNG